MKAQAPEHARTLREFLIHGEKLFSSPAAIYRSMALAKVRPPLGLAEHVVFSPLHRAELQPDIAVFLCNAGQAARLINLAYYETGIPMECDPTGSLCRSVITYPVQQTHKKIGQSEARRQIRSLVTAIRQLMAAPERPAKKIAFQLREKRAFYGKG